MNLPAHYIKCNCLLMMCRYEEVLAYFGKMPPELVIPANRAGLSGLAHALMGTTAEAARCFEELMVYAEGPGGYGAQYYVFLLRANTGEKDQAFEWVRHALDNSLPLCNFADPLVNSLKDDPRYAAFHERIYFVEAADAVVKEAPEPMDADATDRLAVRLLRHMRDQKPFLEPGLSMKALACQLAVHPNELSRSLDEVIGKNFNEFMEGYRAGSPQALSVSP
jgi:AraC-like DNA-binding protein